MNEGPNIREYAHGQVASRLGKLAYEVRSAARKPSADAIHDLRVAVRRFGQSLVVFASLLPPKEVKKIRKRLSRVMDLTGEIRDRDIALELLAKAGVGKSDPLVSKLATGRREAERNLAEKVKRWNQSGFSAKWRAALRLNQHEEN